MLPLRQGPLPQNRNKLITNQGHTGYWSLFDTPRETHFGFFSPGMTSFEFSLGEVELDDIFSLPSSTIMM